MNHLSKYNFHTHSHYDDGKEPLEDFVQAAIEAGLKAYGFSGHSPLPFDNHWSLPTHVLPEYLAEAKRLREKYKHLIDIYVGLEIDYVPGYSENFRQLIDGCGLDYSIGSVHLVMKPGSKDASDIWFIDGPREGYIKGIDTIYGGDAKRAVQAYYSQQAEMVETQKPDIIGHLDKVKMHNKGELFDTASDWHRQSVDHLLDAISASGTIVELNTRGVYTGKADDFFPNNEILKKCFDRDIPVMVNTDAHHPTQVAKLFEEGTKVLKDIGFKKIVTPFFELDIR